MSEQRTSPAHALRSVVEGIPLSQKSLLLFTTAAALIVGATLAVPWFGQPGVSDAAQFESVRQVAELWMDAPPARAAGEGEPPGAENAVDAPDGLHAARVPADRFEEVEQAGGFAAAALRAFREDPEAERRREAIGVGSDRVYRYAAPVRASDGSLEAMVLVESRTSRAGARLFVLRVFMVATGLLAVAGAASAFYFIVNRLVLSPVRELGDVAESVAQGDLGARVELETGDEFEQFAGVFNDMLETLQQQQQRLRGVNESLDLQVTKLSEANVALNEAARLKGDFLATVSHELRTPLNSIIGFADLLLAIARKETPSEDGAVRVDPERYAKRTRYLENIVTAGRSLLEMINDLLEMARIEAGKIELDVSTMNVGSACEGLLALIRPQAERRDIELVFEPDHAGDEAGPPIETDARKFQQIVFNFLSNAVKFTPDGGRVTLRVERLLTGAENPRVRVSVLDTGPGIPPDQQEAIFEKFTQLDSGHRREHQGTGLGLAICRELTSVIQGEIQLVSESGRGAMFSLIVPERMDPMKAAERVVQGAQGRSSQPFGSRRSEPEAGSDVQDSERAAG